MDAGRTPGRMLIIGGAEDKGCDAGIGTGIGSPILERFAGLCGGGKARIVLITTATGQPDRVLADYQRAFRGLGVRHVRELPISGRADADGPAAAKALDDATGVFLSGGDQSRLRTLVGSRLADRLRTRLADGLVVAGTSAGATALGQTMILGGDRSDVSTAAVRTGPGLGLMPRLLIDMHFGERGRLPRLLSAVALDPDRLGVGIDENTAISADSTTFEVLGSGVVSVIDAQRATVVHPASEADPITLFDVRLHLLPAGCVFDIDGRTPAIGPAHARYLPAKERTCGWTTCAASAARTSTAQDPSASPGSNSTSWPAGRPRAIWDSPSGSPWPCPACAIITVHGGGPADSSMPCAREHTSAT